MSGRRRPQRRRPATRRRRSTKSTRSNSLPIPVLLVSAFAGLGLVVTVVRWLMAHWWLLLAAVAVMAVCAAVWGHLWAQRRNWQEAQARGLRYQLAQLDALHHSQFEEAIRDLLRRDGCRKAIRTGGKGDLGADVKATDPQGRLWVVQCKHRKAGAAGSAIGTPDLQVLNGTARPVHKADVVVLMTNGRFARTAPAFAKDQKLHLVDRQLLGQWASGSRPLWDLLDRIPPPRRAAPLA